MRSPMQRAGMMAGVALLVALLLVNEGAFAGVSAGGGDSLRGALEALDRRQRAFQQHPPRMHQREPMRGGREFSEDEGDGEDEDIEFLLEAGQPEDIGYGYQRGFGPHRGPHVTDKQFQELLLKYLENEAADDDNDEREDERWSSPFRERQAEAAAEVARDATEKRAPTSSVFRERQRLHQGSKRGAAPDDRYLMLLAELWEKYQRELDEEQAEKEALEKRQDGYGGYDFYNTPMGWGDGHFNGYYKRSGGAAENDPWFPAFELVPREHAAAKRFPVAKRSSGSPSAHEHDQKKRAGPKVAADLADIFENKNSSNNNTKSTSATSSTTTEAPRTSTAMSQEELHPRAMHKKSVDWSQYFGIDKRKKKSSPESAGAETSEEEEAQKEAERRLMESYYRTMAMATNVKRKRSSGEPHGHVSEANIESLDDKLRTMEDMIVSEAIKFTGAHQGTLDPREKQAVKDKVLLDLAEAYSIEKMRQALEDVREDLEHDGEDVRDKRQGCPEIANMFASCTRARTGFAQMCVWHHACMACAQDENDAKGCDARILNEVECEDTSSCLPGVQRLMALSRSEASNIPCEPCVLEVGQRRRR